jgi:Na+-transporting NADH:ubiquinone oxidoreductase subunit NqrC
LSGLLNRGRRFCRGAKSRQQEQRALDKQRNILAVAGLMQQGMSADEVADIFKAHISPRLVDLASGELLDKDPGKFNQARPERSQQSLQLERVRIRPVSNAAVILPKFTWCAMKSSRFRKWYCRFTVTACGR